MVPVVLWMLFYGQMCASEVIDICRIAATKTMPNYPTGYALFVLAKRYFFAILFV